MRAFEGASLRRSYLIEKGLNMSVIDKIKKRFRKDKAGDIKVRKIGASSIEIGRYTYGYRDITVREWGEGANLKIGAFCSIARGVEVMLGGNHRTDWATTFPFGHIFTEDLGEKVSRAIRVAMVM